MPFVFCLRKRLMFKCYFVVMGGLLAACTPAKTIEAAKKMAKVAMDPDMPIGEPKDQPSKITMSIYAENGVNKNAFGQAAPVDVWLFQLSDDGKLKQVDFVTLTANPSAALGVAYIIHKEAQLEPGKSKIIQDWELKKDTVAIGVAAGYKNIDRVNWRAVEAVKSKGENYKAVIAIRGREIVIQMHR